MQQHLDEISRHVVTGAHAVVLLDQAGWHTTDKLMEPANITMLPLPPKSPELNAQENIWQYLRQNFLSNRVFASYEAILDACQHAWCSLTWRGRTHRLHWHSRLGHNASIFLKVGIRPSSMSPPAHFHFPAILTSTLSLPCASMSRAKRAALAPFPSATRSGGPRCGS